MTVHPPKPGLRTLLTLAWPIVISRSTQVVVGLSDAIMVSFLGEEALAATTTGALDTFVLLILPMGIVFIVQSFAAQLYGKGDEAAARRYGWYGLMVAGATQALCLAALPAVPALTGLLGFAPGVESQLADYLAWRLPAAGAVIGMEALANFYGGLGNTRLPMLASVGAMVMNIVLNWILISGNLGAPAMGVKGAALASTLSTALAFCFLAGKFVWDGRNVVSSRLSALELGRMLRFGIPSGLNWFFEFAAFTFFVNVVLTGLGTTTLAAFMAVLQVNSFSFMPAFGMASAGAILVGQAIGAGQRDQVPATVRLAFTVSAIWQGMIGGLYFFVPEIFLRPFDPGNEALLATGARLLVLSAAWQVFDSAATTLAEALRAAGDTSFTMWARIALAWAVFVPGSLITTRLFGWKELGAVFWLVLYLALLALVLFFRFRTGAWRRIELTDGAPS